MIPHDPTERCYQPHSSLGPSQKTDGVVNMELLTAFLNRER